MSISLLVEVALAEDPAGVVLVSDQIGWSTTDSGLSQAVAPE